ncbi:MAG: hypothetical protein JO101_06935 [Candidatus Eremiobacteraeota bacterium]|nr:hypothetical protein [Candidatus Eremiobacteraeota bacterium]MBV8355038.1 hypothetical protein [Candidatus Eremiobacteraeota bacterium]
MRTFNRIVITAVVLLALALGGCQEKGVAPLAYGTTNLDVLDGQFVSLNEAAGGTVGGSGQSYLLLKVRLTNKFSDQLFPTVNHFILTAVDGTRFYAVDSGSSAFIRVSNNWGPMKRDEVRDFTVGFRVPSPIPGGSVAYEP